MVCLKNENAVEDRSSQGAKIYPYGSSAIMAFCFRPVALRRCFSTTLPFQCLSAKHMPNKLSSWQASEHAHACRLALINSPAYQLTGYQ
jgi:hypothetical protein